MAVSQQLTDWYNSRPSTGGGLLSVEQDQNATKANPALYTPVVNLSPSTYTDTKQGSAVPWNIDENQTVSGQIAKEFGSGSALQQQAKTTGYQTAHERGLLSSSLAAGEAENAMFKNALPIAQQDATTYNRAAGYNVDTQNKINAANVASENTAKSFGATAANRVQEVNAAAHDTASSFGAQALNRANEFNAKNEYDKQQALFEANVKASMSQIESDAKFDQQSQAVFGQLSSDFQTALRAINTDTNMNQQSKDFSINQMFQVYKSQISMLSAIGSVPDISQLLVVQGPGAPNSNAPAPPAQPAIPNREATVVDFRAGTAVLNTSGSGPMFIWR